MANKAAMLVSVMLLSRYLADAEFGRFAYAIALGQIMLFLVDMGIQLMSNRKISSDREAAQSIFETGLGLRVLLGLAGYSLLMLVVLAAGYGGQQTLFIALIGIFAVFEATCEIPYAVFRARERMLFEGITRAAGGAIGLALVAAAVHMGLDPVLAVGSYVVRGVLSTALSLYFVRRSGLRVLPSFHVRERLLPLLRESLPLGIMGLLFVAYQRLDNVVIKGLLGDEAVGAYQQCYRILETLVLAISPTLLPGALFPALCRSVDRGWRVASERVRAMGEFFLALSFVMLLPLLTAGNSFLRLLWGSSFLRGLPEATVRWTFYLVLAALPAQFFLHLLITTVLAAHRQKITPLVTGSCRRLSICLSMSIPAGASLT